ncbi:hypothetical protein RR42_s3316 [Cupriavidus basilensis]|uniref:Uncharacterized protein n=1 Tax=Cupriavidus basilensis TaxID=68895 RepID=A0A0C4YGB1_9BURK|nr:hypothetical protein RR42_s3316 [Cupriavidus basilensis]
MWGVVARSSAPAEQTTLRHGLAQRGCRVYPVDPVNPA